MIGDPAIFFIGDDDSFFVGDLDGAFKLIFFLGLKLGGDATSPLDVEKLLETY